MRAWTGMGIDIFPLCGYPKEAKEQVTFRQEFMYWEMYGANRWCFRMEQIDIL